MTNDPREVGDLAGLADAVICAALDSSLLGEFLAGFQGFTGCAPGPHIREVAAMILADHRGGLHRTPAEVAALLRARADEVGRGSRPAAPTPPGPAGGRATVPRGDLRRLATGAILAWLSEADGPEAAYPARPTDRAEFRRRVWAERDDEAAARAARSWYRSRLSVSPAAIGLMGHFLDHVDWPAVVARARACEGDGGDDSEAGLT